MIAFIKRTLKGRLIALGLRQCAITHSSVTQNSVLITPPAYHIVSISTDIGDPSY